ncbi:MULTISPECIES: FlaG family protein [unclassified Campylobacter]|uniref:FlaG family protein n=1 Tax=unclassified Campylobacter TaxID=2593542 RepID=UPI0014763DFB|nr:MULTISPECIES: FlaG family protein [unclassified Campylobacter]QKG29449.1 flagellar protein FlaG [Campylobacter sp. RM16187]
MEIFKVASQPINTALSTGNTHSQPQTREVEQTQIQPNIVENQTEQNNEDLVKKLNEATEKLNRQMEALDTNIRFAYNDKINFLYVNVMEMKTGEIIRKIPSEQVMKLSEYFREAVGVLFDKES